MKAAIQVFLIATSSSLVHPNAIAQPKPLSLAYQVTYVDNATPTFSPDGKRMIFESVTDGKEQLYAMELHHFLVVATLLLLRSAEKRSFVVLTQQFREPGV